MLFKIDYNCLYNLRRFQRDKLSRACFLNISSCSNLFFLLFVTLEASINKTTKTNHLKNSTLDSSH